MTGDFYILEGKKVVPVATLEEWARGMAGVERHVAFTEIAPGLVVSTIFLGVDHRHTIFGKGPPLLFETMVFKDGEGEDQERYSTWEEAEAGHARFVADQRRRNAH
jgi:hypothetical protein